MSSTASLLVTRPQPKHNRTSGSASPQKAREAWKQYTGGVWEQTAQKKPSAAHLQHRAASARAPSRLLALRRARLIACGLTATTGVADLGTPTKRQVTVYKQNDIFFPVSVPRTTFGLWEVIWIEAMFSREKGASVRFRQDITKEVSSGQASESLCCSIYLTCFNFFF